MSDWDPGAKYRFYLDAIDDILSNGDERTVRDIYYALEATGFPEKCEERGWQFEYKYVKRAVKKGRRAGFIDPSKVFDASRPVEVSVDESSDIESYLKWIDSLADQYDENAWGEQDHYVEVWLEKQSLATVFAPICAEYNVRLEATRGDWSDSKVYEATKRLQGELGDGKDVRVLYFGDFNPSGLHAPISIQETMGHYGIEIPRGKWADVMVDGAAYFDIWPPGEPAGYENNDATLMFERVALNLEHIQRYYLPANPTPSSTDKDRNLKQRFMDHVTEGRDVNIELNALKEYHRDDLENMIRDAIDQYWDEEIAADVDDRVDERREEIDERVDVDLEGL